MGAWGVGRAGRCGVRLLPLGTGQSRSCGTQVDWLPCCALPTSVLCCPAHVVARRHSPLRRLCCGVVSVPTGTTTTTSGTGTRLRKGGGRSTTGQTPRPRSRCSNGTPTGKRSMTSTRAHNNTRPCAHERPCMPRSQQKLAAQRPSRHRSALLEGPRFLVTSFHSPVQHSGPEYRRESLLSEAVCIRARCTRSTYRTQ